MAQVTLERLSEPARDVLRNLRSTDYEARMHVISEAAPESCSWILDHQLYMAWVNAQSSTVLWLASPAASGKSVLSKYLIQELRRSRPSDTVCYFFFGRGPHDQDTASALSAVLHQLLMAHPSLIDPVLSELMERSRNYGKDVGGLWRMLLLITQNPSCGNVVCVLDGLDESHDSDRLMRLLANFDSSDMARKGSLKFFCTSRIESEYGQFPTIHIESAWVGFFFWTQVYRSVIQRSPNNFKTREMLQMIIGAYRALTIQEFGILCGLKTSTNVKTAEDIRRHLANYCGDLIFIDQNKIQPSSPLLKELILLDKDSGSQPARIEDLHYNLAENCIKYLLSDEFMNEPPQECVGFQITSRIADHVDSYVARHGFLQYSATYWAAHARMSGKTEQIEGDVSKLCDTKSKKFWTWFPVYWNTVDAPGYYPIGFTDLLVASYFGLSAHAMKLLERGCSIEEKDSNGQSALHLAARNGHTETVQVLLKFIEASNVSRLKDGHRSDSNDKSNKAIGVDATDKEVCTPLHRAAEGGHLRAAEALVAAHASLSVVDGEGATPLHRASSKGREAVVRFLIDKNADVLAKNKAGRTARKCAEEALETAKDSEGQAGLKSLIGLLKLAEFSASNLANTLDSASKQVESAFEASVVRISRNGHPSVRHERWRVNDLLNKEHARVIFMEEKKGVINWIHLPANNMVWVEILMKLQEDLGSGPTTEEVLHKDRWVNQQHKGSTGPHARFMKPMAYSTGYGPDGDFVKGGISTLFMPYIHWDTKDKVSDMTEIIMRSANQATKANEHDNKHASLVKEYLNTKERNPLHIRRTFDQYCYYTLKDTRDRDQNQTLGRVVKCEDFHGRVPTLMVDQLWLWVLGEDTIITSFPERWSRGKSPDPDSDGFSDVLENILKNIGPAMLPIHLVGLIVNECVRACLDFKRHFNPNLDVLEIYENEIGRITDAETRCFDKLAKGVHNFETQKSDHQDHDFLNISEEISLLRDIKDVRDELHTMGVIFEDQNEVLESFYSLIGSYKSHSLADAKLFTRENIPVIGSMDNHAEQTYAALNHLLDLKQKLANVMEARWSRRQTEESARQGNTIMVFTIVTIIFLPLSFMVAFFALNIAEFPKGKDGMHLDFVSKYMFSISAVIVVPLVLLAFKVNEAGDMYTHVASWMKKKSTFKSETKPGEKSRSTEDKEKALDEEPTSNVGNDDSSTREDKSSLLPYLFLYLLFTLPVKEVQFACQLLLQVSPESATVPTAQISSQQGIQGTQQERNDASEHQKRTGTSEVSPVEESQSQGKSPRLPLRDGIKYPFVVIITVARLCLIPVWVSLLCLESFSFIAVYGLCFLLFKVNPLNASKDRLWGSNVFSLGSRTSRGGE